MAFTIAQAAELAGLSQDAIHKHTQRGTLKFHKVGKLVMIEEDDLHEWLRARAPYPPIPSLAQDELEPLQPGEIRKPKPVVQTAQPTIGELMARLPTRSRRRSAKAIRTQKPEIYRAALAKHQQAMVGREDGQAWGSPGACRQRVARGGEEGLTRPVGVVK